MSAIIVRGYTGTVITRGYADGPVPTIIISADTCTKFKSSVDTCAKTRAISFGCVPRSVVASTCAVSRVSADTAFPLVIRNEV